MSVTAADNDPILPKVRLGKLSEFREQSKNANAHNERGIQMLDDSMIEDGYVAPMTAVADGEIIDGSARLDRAYERFGEDVIVIEHNGQRPIITVRSDIDNAESEIAKRISIRANRVAQVDLAWDINVLAEMKAEGVATEKLWTDKEWNLLVPEETGSADADVSLNRAAEIQEKWHVATGEIIQIGRHRLMCGDCTKPDDVACVMKSEKAEMMFCDPPYGVGYDGGHFHSGDVNIKRARPKLVADETSEIYSRFLPIILPHVAGPCYMWFAGREGRAVFNAVDENACEIHALLIWNKTNATYAAMNAQYKQRHEPCLYFKPKGSTLRWIGPSDECTVWDVDRDATNEWHPTQKPIELSTRAMKNHDAKIVLDCFAGSGSTAVSAENLSKQAILMEIVPANCAVILERMTRAFPDIQIEREKAAA